MLVLTRHPGESIILAGAITITIVNIGHGRVKLGIEAPSQVSVDRKEIHEKLQQSANVLAVCARGQSTREAQHTMINSGAGTSTVVAQASTTQPEPVTPALQPSKLTKYRCPRRSR